MFPLCENRAGTYVLPNRHRQMEIPIRPRHWDVFGGLDVRLKIRQTGAYHPFGDLSRLDFVSRT